MGFKEGAIRDVEVKNLKRWKDERGWLAETFRHDELPEKFHPQMSYISVSYPNVQRGPHEHDDQADLFVFIGPGTFRMWMWDNRKDSPTYQNRMVIEGGEEKPISVLVPAGVVHAYKNVSNVTATVLNYPNRLFMGPGKKSPIDEIRHEDDPNTIYQCE